MHFTMMVEPEDGEKIERVSKMVNDFSRAAQHKMIDHYGVLHLVKDNITKTDLKALENITNMQATLPNPLDLDVSERRLIELKHEILSAWNSDLMLGIMKHALGSEEVVESLNINPATMIDDINTMDKYGMRKAAELMRFKIALAMSME